MGEVITGLPDEISRECLIRVPYKQFSTVLAVSKRWKEETDSKLFHGQRKNRGFIQNLIALIQSDPIMAASGTAKNAITTPVYRLSLYEPGKNEWEKLPPIPGYSDHGLPLFCRCAGVGRNLVVIGGWNTTTWQVLDSVYVYDLVTATWRRGACIPGEKRSFFACASDSNRTVFVAGGHDKDKNALRSALAYDVVKDEWIQLPDMAKQRDECKGLFHGGKFHVIGGYQTETQGLFDKTSEAFDVSTWKWGQVEEDKLQANTCLRTCVFDHEGTLYMCEDAYMSRLEGSTWQQFTELPADVRTGTCVVTWGEKMLVIGSGMQGGLHSCYVLEFRKEKQYSWTKVGTPKEFTGYVQSGCNLEL